MDRGGEVLLTLPRASFNVVIPPSPASSLCLLNMSTLCSECEEVVESSRRFCIGELEKNSGDLCNEYLALYLSTDTQVLQWVHHVSIEPGHLGLVDISEIEELTMARSKPFRMGVWQGLSLGAGQVDSGTSLWKRVEWMARELPSILESRPGLISWA